jgi:single-strand DNA-binding protein
MSERSISKTILVGRVGSIPEIRTTAAGKKVAKFSLATTDRYKDRSEQWQEKTQWHRLTAFGPIADVCEKYIDKGARLYLEGKIEYSQTEGDDGKPKYWTDIIVNELVMLDSKNGKETDPFA